MHLLVFLWFIYDAVSNSGYIMPNITMNEEQLLGKGVEEIGRGLV
jgi:hypothetical protein